jgi:hypothetical protein
MTDPINNKTAAAVNTSYFSAACPSYSKDGLLITITKVALFAILGPIAYVMDLIKGAYDYIFPTPVEQPKTTWEKAQIKASAGYSWVKESYNNNPKKYIAGALVVGLSILGYALGAKDLYCSKIGYLCQAPKA